LLDFNCRKEDKKREREKKKRGKEVNYSEDDEYTDTDNQQLGGGMHDAKNLGENLQNENGKEADKIRWELLLDVRACSIECVHSKS
jgi:hypothetical protein